MTRIAIVTDSSCDVPQRLADQHGIHIVPLNIRFGAQEYVDRKDLSPDEFWRKVSESKTLPETSAPSPGAFEQAFRSAAEGGADGIVCVNISRDLSATIQSAELAAQAVSSDIPVRVVDSRSASIGQGLLALAAARLAEAGKGLEDVAGGVEDLVPRTRVYAALDTLENLRKGGRIGGAQAMLGSMLSIKPIIEITNGKVEAESKQRTRSKSLRYLVEKVRADLPVEHLAVLHGNAPDVDEVVDQLGELFPREEILVDDIGAVIGTHGGPRVVGVGYFVGR